MKGRIVNIRQRMDGLIFAEAIEDIYRGWPRASAVYIFADRPYYYRNVFVRLDKRDENDKIFYLHYYSNNH